MMHYVFDLLVLGIIAFGVTYSTVAVALLWLEISRQKRARKSTALPFITVLKPLKGLDEDLEDNLRSFFTLEYPAYELVFGVNDSDDPAIAVVSRLRREYPHVKSRLIVDEYRAGLNPKVNNLVNMQPWIQADWVVISDSNVTATPEYLKNLARYTNFDNVALVTSTIRGSGARTLGASLENLHLNTFISPSIFAVSKLFGVPVTIGKSMLLRRSVLDQLGGFRAFVNYLMEDGLLGRRIAGAGYDIRYTAAPVTNINRDWSVAQFISRHFRWASMRRFFGFGNYCAEALGFPIVTSAVYFAMEPDLSSSTLLAGITAYKIGLSYVAARLMDKGVSFSTCLLEPVREALLASVWVLPFFTRTVTWRGNRFRMSQDTRLHPVSDSITEANPTVG